MKTIGIVILNYKTYKDTIRLVRDLNTFNVSSYLHIVVVDNESPNESYDVLSNELAEYNNVDVIQSGENGGYAKGNNIGLRFLEKKNPDYALILNNDVYFDEDILTKCVQMYDELDDVGIISPIQKKPNGEVAYLGTLKCNTFIEDLLSFSIIWGKLRRKRKYKVNRSNNLMAVDIIPGCFIFINYNLFKNVGFYDEDTFLFCEERFLYKKMQQNNKVNYIMMDCVYIHDHSLTINSEVAKLRQKKMYNDGQIVFCKKYRSFPRTKAVLLKAAYCIYSIEVKAMSFLKENSNRWRYASFRLL